MYKWKKRVQNEKKHVNSNFKLPKIFENSSNVRANPEDSNYTINCLSGFSSCSSYQKNSIAKINIPQDKLEKIHEVMIKMQPIVSVSYENLENSLFKTNFLEKRMVTIEEKMDFFQEELSQKPDIDYELFVENNLRYENQTAMRLYNIRKKLPSFQKRNQILKMIQENQVVLISGDTGCGKTTQIPQFLLDDYMASYKGSLCKIICTQPRRISAVSVAERVAMERGETLGISVGYQIRLERVPPRKYGSILFVTNGIVIRLMESDPTLKYISHLIIDEIHERDIHSDFLLTLVKQLISRRKDLKVILMSATLNEKRFKEYFDNCGHVEISGLSHRVDQYYLENVVHRLNYRFQSCTTRSETMERNTMIFQTRVMPYVRHLQNENLYPDSVCQQLSRPQSEEINLDLIFQLTMDICKKEGPGAILIFVTGYDDINKLYNLFYDLSEDEYCVIPLHSEIPIEDQKYVFHPAPPGVRKIIISTNIAETSITIDDVVFVIDSGWAKTKVFDPKKNTENLEPRFISKANAIQRRGRAGRLRAGKCFHLYTKARFDALYDYQKPEILRCRLENLMLQMKFLQLGKVTLFFEKMLDKPNSETIHSSLKLLKDLGALDEEEALTPLGYYLAKLPMAPQLGKMLLHGVMFRCLEPILNIAVCLDYKKPFNLNLRLNTKSRTPQMDPKAIEFAENIKSDHLLLHKALYLYKKLDKSAREEFSKEYNINITVIKMLKKLKKEFMNYLLALELVNTDNPQSRELNVNSTNIELLKSIIYSGLYPNVIRACSLMGQPKANFLTLNDNKVVLHPKSILSCDKFFSSPLLVFYIKMNTRMDMVHDATVCSPFPAILFGNDFCIEKTMNTHFMVVNEKMRFTCEKNVSGIIEQLRVILSQFITHRLVKPSCLMTDTEERFLKIIVDLLASKESSRQFS